MKASPIMTLSLIAGAAAAAWGNNGIAADTSRTMMAMADSYSFSSSRPRMLNQRQRRRDHRRTRPHGWKGGAR